MAGREAGANGGAAGWELRAAELEKFAAFGERYRAEAALRSRLDSGDTADALAELGVPAPPGAEARFVADTDEVRHFVLPPDPNAPLADETLRAVAGGDTFGTAGTASTVMTVPSTVSSGGTTSTLGSARV